MDLENAGMMDIMNVGVETSAWWHSALTWGLLGASAEGCSQGPSRGSILYFTEATRSLNSTLWPIFGE